MVSGIIAEFNIFHNGHKYIVNEAKKNSDAVIAVMSGSFVQRGDVAIADKWSRADMALRNGVDLVLELPVCYALNAAPNFAAGGVNTLHMLGANTLVFGSECGDTAVLCRAARLLDDDTRSAEVKALMSEGLSYPAALSDAYKGELDGNILSAPNNILAVEYIRAINRYCSDMTPCAIRRLGAEHDGAEVIDSVASASHIREMLCQGRDISALVPYPTDIIGSRFDISLINSAIIARLRTMSAEDLRSISEVGEGLENRILAAAKEADSFEELCAAVKSKRYTMSRIRRIVISALLGFTKDIYSPTPDYIRVLGMNKTGASLLKKAKKNCPVPIITKTADFKENSRRFALDIRSSDIAALCCQDKNKRNGGADFTRSPVITEV